MVDDASGDRDGTADDGTSVSDPDTPADDAARRDLSSERTDATETVGTADTAESDDARIPIDLSGDSNEATDGDDDDPDADDPYAPEPSSTPIEAGDPDLENAVFVVLGAIAMILVFVRLASLPL